MLKIALIGDLHLSERSPRYQHGLEVLDVVIDELAGEAEDCDFVSVLLGDLCEGAPTPREYRDLGERVANLAAFGGVGLVLGNHEHPETLTLFDVFDRWTGEITTAWDKIHVIDRLAARIQLIPYPRRGRPPFNDLRHDGTIAGSMRAAAERIGDAVNAELEALAGAKPLIVAGHFTVEGMAVRDSDFELHSAAEVVVPQAAFRGVALVAVGHIHRAQRVAENIVGVGSLIRHSFAEADDMKHYTLVEVEDSEVRWKHAPVPARRMFTFAFCWPLDETSRHNLAVAAADTPEHEVKCIVHVPEDHVATFDASVFDDIKTHAAHFVLEKVVIPIERTRAPEIAKTDTLGGQIEAWLTATEQALPPARLERVLAKAEEVRA